MTNNNLNRSIFHNDSINEIHQSVHSSLWAHFNRRLTEADTASLSDLAFHCTITTLYLTAMVGFIFRAFDRQAAADRSPVTRSLMRCDLISVLCVTPTLFEVKIILTGRAGVLRGVV